MSIRIEHQGPVVTLSFDRPDRKNAITAAMYAALADGLNAAAADGGARVAVIGGSAAAFTAGNDLGDFLNNPPSGDDTPVFRFLRAIATFPKPLIAAVCGPAVGVGTTLLLHCDLVYAGDNARFALPFANLGLCPEAASSLLLPRLAGHARAAEKLLFGEPFDANEARAMGLVNEVLPADQVAARAQVRAQELATRPLSSLLVTKALMRAPVDEAIAAQMTAEGKHFRRMLGEPAAKEAFSAFLQKRKADFSKV
ncbi:MAG TPA: enoyl-CoA hydratase [Burkholderiaceae bacterium]|nr:enoyl-CoA hydratase [Burkholderiaceae bacterium]